MSEYKVAVITRDDLLLIERLADATRAMAGLVGGSDPETDALISLGSQVERLRWFFEDVGLVRVEMKLGPDGVITFSTDRVTF